MRSVSGRHHRWIGVSIGVHIPVDAAWRPDPSRRDRRRGACAVYTSRSHATNETGDGWAREAPGNDSAVRAKRSTVRQRQSVITTLTMYR